MDLATVSHLYQLLKQDHLSFVYSGTFNDTVTGKLINLSDHNIEHVADIKKIKNKVGFLMVECFQNIIRHNDPEADPKAAHGYFMTRNIGKTQYISSGNLVKKEIVDELSGKMDHVNRLSKDELKAYYFKVLSNELLSDKGGAGLGLIEMSRKSGHPLYYKFEPVDDRLSYFYFQIKIDRSEEGDMITELDIEDSVSFRKTLEEKSIFLIYKGDFSMATIMPILKMAEGNVAHQEEELAHQKKVVTLLVEVLQNISKHSASDNGIQDGILLMGKNGDRFTIGASNLVHNDAVPSFKGKLDRLNEMSLEEKNQFYKEMLRSGDADNLKGASLGLIDLSRRSAIPMEYEFNPADDHNTLYSLKLEI